MRIFETENTVPISDEERERMYREALEAENDEYNYGHNVHHVPTDDDGYPLIMEGKRLFKE